MTYPQLSDLITRLRREMDLLDEVAVTDTEVTQALNSGINVAESAIHDLHEDYFLTRTTLSLTGGSSDVSLPSDIWGQKVRALIYKSGSTVFEIPRAKGLRLFERIERGLSFGVVPNYSYIIYNDTSPTLPKFKIIPAPTATESNVIVCWYIRNAKKLSSSSDQCDIPEWEDYIIEHAKMLIAKDKPGLGDYNALKEIVESLYNRMLASLSNRTPDEWDQVAMDLSTYEEHS